ncbi:MAG: apolipoprotein N-acyltransferase [Lonepinella koalarum]|nr:apolipoprotein N-acyltransferase [Lonepinella koalarum]
MNKFTFYLVALISGGIGVLAFSPFDYWGVAYFSAFGLIFIAKTAPKPTALWATFLWGLSFFSIGTHWLNVSIHQFGGSPLWLSYILVVLLAAYLSVYPVLFTYIIQRFNVKSAVIFPIIWTFTEFLRGWVFTGFPWLQFGYTQIDSPFSGIAPFFGVTGLTFFVIWGSAVSFNLLSALWQTPKKYPIAIAHLFMLLVVSAISAVASKVEFIQEKPEKALTITLLQGNIEQQLKWDPDYLYQTLDIYRKMITTHLGKSDIIVLPESALPALENQLQFYYQPLQQAALKAGSELIVGSVYYDENIAKLLNSIVILGDKNQDFSSQNAQRYSKHHLVPFGEYVPLESLLRPLGSVFNLPMSAFHRGEEIQPPLLSKGHYFSSAICYEIIEGAQLQRNLTEKTDFILTVSNDAWFGDSIGPWQHLQMARMRALELGRPVIRSTNTGVTAFINHQGKITAQAPQFIETALTHKIAPTEGKTPYAVLGDKPLYLLSLLLLFLRFFSYLMQRKSQKRVV